MKLAIVIILFLIFAFSLTLPTYHSMTRSVQYLSREDKSLTYIDESAFPISDEQYKLLLDGNKYNASPIGYQLSFNYQGEYAIYSSLIISKKSSDTIGKCRDQYRDFDYLSFYNDENEDSYIFTCICKIGKYEYTVSCHFFTNEYSLKEQALMKAESEGITKKLLFALIDNYLITNGGT